MSRVAPRPSPAPGPTAFILDDDQGVRTMLGRLLKSAQLQAEAFSTPDALADRLSDDVTGCLVLDVRMPWQNGLDLYDTLVSSGKGLPVVFLSAHLDVSLTVRAMKAGAIDVLKKPWHGPTLLDAVKRGFEADQRRRENLKEVRHIKLRFESLTPREHEVLAQVVLGHANKVIASELGMSEKTVKAHRGHLMRKLAALSVADLVRIASHFDSATRHG
jgi:FixJ family two-component response regulator